MNRQHAVNQPQHTAKYPHIEFEVVNDRQKQLDELLTARPEEAVNVVAPVNDVRKIQPVKTVVIEPDIVVQVQQALEQAKPFVNDISKVTVKVIRAGGYMTGFVIVKSIKYILILAGALIGGLIMSFVDLFENHSFDSVQGFQEDEFEQQEPNFSNFNNTTFNNSTVNIQINNKL